jgi:hypothetical protein
MKICITCNNEKEINEFYKNKANKDGYNGKCKECTKEAVKKYREDNLEEVKERVNTYRKNNKDAAIAYNKKWREENKEYKKQKDREYRLSNVDKIKKRNKKYYANNKDILLEKSRNWIKENKEYKKRKDREYQVLNRDKRNKRHKERMNEDVVYRTSHIASGLIKASFKRNGFTKRSKTMEILGCTYEEFRIYLESKFEDWMNWNNRGLYNKDKFNYGWDIDHIIPMSTAQTEEDAIKLNHYTNLQPLCSKINRDIKKEKLDYK